MLINIHPLRIADNRDGTSKTFITGEVAGGAPGSGMGTPWAQYSMLDATRGINGAGTIPGDGTYVRWLSDSASFSSYHPGGCHFGYVDGSVHYFSEDIDADVLSYLCTREGREVFSAP